MAQNSIHYALGYLSGRSYAFPSSLSDLYGFTVSKVTSIATLPLPLLSFVAIPFFGTPTTISLTFFWLAWSTLVLSHGPLRIELMGTLVIRLLCFLVPALGFLGFDLLVPRLSRGIKARRQRSLPQHELQPRQLLQIAGVATGNVLLSVAVQGLLELVTTRVFHLRSILKVSTILPLPWSILRSLLGGFILHGVLHYGIHRYLLHTYDSALKSWHLRWQHSISLPFSLVAAYDHPVAYLVGSWFPVFIPAYLFRWHVLTWHLFVAITSLSDLFTYSGYAVLPSTIIFAGMARRTDAHFEEARKRGPDGNFGHLGLMDLICQTSLSTANDFVQDMKTEAEKHELEDQVQAAVAKAMAGLDGGKGGTKKTSSARREAAAPHEEETDEQQSTFSSRSRRARKG